MKKTLFLLTCFLLIGVSCTSKLPTAQIHTIKDISEESKKGCRAPNDSGCSHCLLNIQEKCFDFFFNKKVNANTPDIYNGDKIVSCNTNLPLCAPCSKQAEKTLSVLISSPEFQKCECDPKAQYLDPCFSPKSCACLCATYQNLTTKDCTFN